MHKCRFSLRIRDNNQNDLITKLKDMFQKVICTLKKRLYVCLGNANIDFEKRRSEE